MAIPHEVHEGVLHLALPGDLDVPRRAAAALHLEMLLFTHRPTLVRVQLSSAEPSAASLSVLARARHLCEGLGIRLSVVGPAAAHPPTRPAAA